ncbi:MAG: flagellar biosynthesis protein FlhB [Nitrospinae bacterium CG11_big_fil_rev_8_21_14_0_20_56_8]|nr:MAG: flagellar biosynthesis protein FlhB [Nitrospinae bacterium CG11_big_fil_rev_8_21_14_0_20_56_8]
MKSNNKHPKIRSAVSLKYRASQDKAPKVTAKGKGAMADRIIALAREKQIPIKEDPDLVEVLSQVDVGKEIPPSVYKVVAEILAFIYHLNQKYPERVGSSF